MFENIVDQYIKLNLLGQGNFGRVFLARRTTDNLYVALKIEQTSEKSFLDNEKSVLDQLQNCPGIPKLISFGETSSLKYLAIELLGQSLEDRFIECNRKFLFNDYIKYCIQILDIIENIHSHHIIHRDLKPRQLLFSAILNKDQLYLIDFGISMKYKNPEHIPYSQNCGFAGTYNFCSVFSHYGFQQSRRDDLESFCYIMAYFYTGTLPWIKESITVQEILKIKSGISGKDLFGNNAKDLSDVFKCVKQLEFEDEPNYEYIREKIRKHYGKVSAGGKALKQYSTMPVSKPKKIKKKFMFIDDTEGIVLNLDTTVVNSGPTINRALLRK